MTRTGQRRLIKIGNWPRKHSFWLPWFPCHFGVTLGDPDDWILEWSQPTWDGINVLIVKERGAGKQCPDRPKSGWMAGNPGWPSLFANLSDERSTSTHWWGPRASLAPTLTRSITSGALGHPRRGTLGNWVSHGFRSHLLCPDLPIGTLSNRDYMVIGIDRWPKVRQFTSPLACEIESNNITSHFWKSLNAPSCY